MITQHINRFWNGGSFAVTVDSYFGMGNDTSSQKGEELPEQQYGYRVLGVQAASPASAVGLVSFFDFVVEANGVALYSKEVHFFVNLIKEFEDRPLPLLVYNCKKHCTREVVLVPTRNWPGEGLLGVAIRFDTYHDAEEHLCHVLEVEVDSPAELAGLQPGTDYLLGTADLVFSEASVLSEELSLHVDKTTEFYVYNSETDQVRVAVIMPSKQWGGEGLLGANVAYGYLHGLPSKCCETLGSSTEMSLSPALQLLEGGLDEEEEGEREGEGGGEAHGGIQVGGH